MYGKPKWTPFESSKEGLVKAKQDRTGSPELPSVVRAFLEDIERQLA